MTGFLEQAVSESRRRVAQWQEIGLLERIGRRADGLRERVDFAQALRAVRAPAIIAEIKRASPSKGVLNAALDASAQARCYAAAGAAAISVLTESIWFAGSLEDLSAATNAADLPILRKDFIVDPYDLEVSRAVGADAVLLIVAALAPAELRSMLEHARRLGLSALVEVHTRAELETALEVGAEIIGVNSRDLRTLQVDVPAALTLLEQVPDDRLRVFESGIRSDEDVEAALDHGASAILVGEALVRSTDPGSMIQRWQSLARMPQRQGGVT